MQAIAFTAAFQTAFTAPFQTAFTDRPDPVAGPGQALLAVRHVGLCGSDLNTFRGLNPLVSLPRIPGHEIGGVIKAVGAGVDLLPGRAAIVIPYTTCGECAACRQGRVNACRFNKTLGVQQDGGLSAHIVVAADRLILNDRLPPDVLALVEPLSVGFHAVARGRVAAAEVVVVLGGGMIGVGVILGALARGAPVIAVEIARPKPAMLRALGVEAVLDPTACDLPAEVAALTGGLGPDVVVEAVGTPATFRAAVDLAACAGRVVCVGYAKAEVSCYTALFNLNERDIHGSRNATRSDFEAVIGWLEANVALARRLISKVFAFADAVKAFDHRQDNRDDIFKILVRVADAE